MIDQQEIETGAEAPARRVWMVWLAIAGVLAIVLGGSWLLTPHLASDQVPEAVGVVPNGGTTTLATAADANPSDTPGWYETNFHVRNTGLLPVTISQPSPAEMSGTGTTHRVDLALSRTGSQPYYEEMRLGPGEEAVVVLRIYATMCSDPGASESLTTVKDLILRAQVGPISRDSRVSAWATQHVVTEDGSALPVCP